MAMLCLKSRTLLFCRTRLCSHKYNSDLLQSCSNPSSQTLLRTPERREIRQELLRECPDDVFTNTTSTTTTIPTARGHVVYHPINNIIKQTHLCYRVHVHDDFSQLTLYRPTELTEMDIPVTCMLLAQSINYLYITF